MGQNKEQLKSSSTLAAVYNSYLDLVREKLLKQVLLWDAEGISWNPKQLKAILSERKKLSSPCPKDMLVVNVIDQQIHFSRQKNDLKMGS